MAKFTVAQENYVKTNPTKSVDVLMIETGLGKRAVEQILSSVPTPTMTAEEFVKNAQDAPPPPGYVSKLMARPQGSISGNPIRGVVAMTEAASGAAEQEGKKNVGGMSRRERIESNKDIHVMRPNDPIY